MPETNWRAAKHQSINKHGPKKARIVTGPGPGLFPILWGSETAGPHPGEDPTIQWLCDVYDDNRHVALVLWVRGGRLGMGFCSESGGQRYFWSDDISRPNPGWSGCHRTQEHGIDSVNDLWMSFAKESDSQRMREAYTAAFNEGMRRLGYASRR